jgi:hypothetical protein
VCRSGLEALVRLAVVEQVSDAVHRVLEDRWAARPALWLENWRRLPGSLAARRLRKLSRISPQYASVMGTLGRIKGQNQRDKKVEKKAAEFEGLPQAEILKSIGKEVMGG